MLIIHYDATQTILSVYYLYVFIAFISIDVLFKLFTNFNNQ